MIVATLALVLAQPQVVDGDTIATDHGRNRVRYRLGGIDAPELPGHCRRDRHCAPGDPFAAKAELSRFIAGKRVTFDATGRDRYGRPVGILRANGVNVSCHMLATGRAVFVPTWDDGGRVGKECGR